MFTLELLGRVTAAGRVGRSFPYIHSWWDASSVLGLVLSSPVWNKHNTVESVQQQAMKMINWHTRRDWESWDCYTWKRKGSGCSYPCVQIPYGKIKTTKPDPAQWCPETQEAIGHKVKCRKFHYGGYKVAMVEYSWWWLNTGTDCPRRLWVSAFGDTQNATGHGPEQHAVADPAWKGLGQMTSRGAPPFSSILWFCIY